MNQRDDVGSLTISSIRLAMRSSVDVHTRYLGSHSHPSRIFDNTSRKPLIGSIRTARSSIAEVMGHSSWVGFTCATSRFFTMSETTSLHSLAASAGSMR
jgi:hypothetical protein